MSVLVALHVIVLVVFRGVAVPSNALTAAVPFVAGLCCLWRCAQLPQRERPAWIWIAIGLFVWSAAQAVFTYISGNNWNLYPAPDFSDLLFFDAEIAFFLAISNTYNAQSSRGVFYLNVFQAAMATVLVYIRLFKIPMQPADATAALYQIYWGECLLLAVAATLRLVTWSTEEERFRNRVLCLMLWMYLPVDIVLDYPSSLWQPEAGTIFSMVGRLPKGELFELLWSVPFLFLAWQVLRAPIRSLSRGQAMRPPKKGTLLLRSFYPMMINCALFGLAVSITRYYLYLGLTAILLLLLVQGFHSCVIQVSYLMGQANLRSKEQELKAANQELERQSMLDPLTGIPNRRYFTDAFEAEWKRASRKNESLAILMIDLDFFKGVNDVHGHPYGDECLVLIANAFCSELQRPVDVVARYGGEEFIVLLPDTRLEGAATVARSLQTSIEELNIVNKASPYDQRLTMSIGIAVASPSSASSRDELIAQADHALYRAKREGRNRIRWHEEGTPWRVPEAVEAAAE
jgi:diguanylate cyclase (GGDEF)-like protein